MSIAGPVLFECRKAIERATLDSNVGVSIAGRASSVRSDPVAPTRYNPTVAADPERARKMRAELEALARDGKLTMTGYLELSTEAADAADGAISSLPDGMALMERVQPDYDRLREIGAEVERLERNGAMTPIRYARAMEEARIAVGPNGARFVERILSTGLERSFVEELLAGLDS